MRSARCRPRCRGVSIRCACVRRASVSMPRVSDGGSSSRGCCADAGCRGRSHPSASGSDGSMPQAAAMRRRGGRRVVWRLRRIISSPSWRGRAAPATTLQASAGQRSALGRGCRHPRPRADKGLFRIRIRRRDLLRRLPRPLWRRAGRCCLRLSCSG